MRVSYETLDRIVRNVPEPIEPTPEMPELFTVSDHDLESKVREMVESGKYLNMGGPLRGLPPEDQEQLIKQFLQFAKTLRKARGLE